MNFLRGFGKAYNRSMERRPVFTQMCCAGGLFSMGDFCAQMLEFGLGVTSPGKKGYNFKRTGRMLVYGFFVAGPIYYGWYTTLGDWHVIARVSVFRTRVTTLNS